MRKSLIPRFRPIDDALADLGKNGLPARADVLHKAVASLNAIAYRGRPIWPFWGGEQAAPGDTTRSDYLRFPWDHYSRGTRRLQADLLTIRQQVLVNDGAGLKMTIGGNLYQYYAGEAHAGEGGAPAIVIPRHCEPLDVGGDVDEGTYENKETLIEMRGSEDSSAPHTLHGGLFYEPPTEFVDPSEEGAYVPLDFIGPGLGIPAESKSGNTSNIQRLQSRFLHVWNRMKSGGVILWPAQPSAGFAFTIDETNYRYILDQTIGVGGAAASETGPGFTFPVYKCGPGRSGFVKIGAYVYAKMSGSTKTGSVAIAHRGAGGGSMTGWVTPTVGGPTISGTSFAWYPALSADPMVWTNGGTADVEYDNILFGAKSSGAGEHVVVRGLFLFPMHSTTIP